MCKKKGRKFVGFDPISRVHFGLLWCGGFGGMGLLMDGGFCGLCGMEENKKSGGGDVRAEALSWDGEWDKV